MEHLDPELLSAYIDHELPAADMAAVEQHLAACDACRAEYDELRGLATLVRELPIYEPKRVVDVTGHPHGGSGTLARIIAFSKPLAIAAMILLVAFAGLRLLTDDGPEEEGGQISFSAVQPTAEGTESARQASEGQAPDASFAEAPPDQESAADAEAPMAAMSARQSAATAQAPEPVATVAPTPAPARGADSDAWLPVAIVAAVVVALAGAGGWYRFVRRPRRRGTRSTR